MKPCPVASGRCIEVCVGAFIFNGTGKLLLCRLVKMPGLWTVPGGHVEMGEKLEEALRREVTEETGLKISRIAPLGFSERVFERNFCKRHVVFLDFRCNSKSSKVIANCEILECTWASPGAALGMELERGVRAVISSNYAAGVRTPRKRARASTY